MTAGGDQVFIGWDDGGWNLAPLPQTHCNEVQE
jgi:hypothetical protein